jgi:hypothetical protein
MRKNSLMSMAIASLVSSLLATSAYATLRTQQGLITVLAVPSTVGNIPGVVDIVLDQPLAATGCPGGTRGFEFDSNSVTDADTRKNMLSMLLGAKLTGANVTIVYDDGNTFCSTHGFAVPYSIQLN